MRERWETGGGEGVGFMRGGDKWESMNLRAIMCKEKRDMRGNHTKQVII